MLVFLTNSGRCSRFCAPVPFLHVCWIKSSLKVVVFSALRPPGFWVRDTLPVFWYSNIRILSFWANDSYFTLACPLQHALKHVQQKVLRLYNREHRSLLNSCVSPVDLLSFFIRIPCLILLRYQISLSFELLLRNILFPSPVPGSPFLAAFGLSLSTKEDTPWTNTTSLL